VAAAAVLALAAGVAEAKTLRLNIEADPAMIDPITYSELVSGNILRNVYEGFTKLDKNGNITPGLAVRCTSPITGC
jgi:peptide/nickel transport system substrate-binding protein